VTTNLPDGSNAITRSDKTFSFFLNSPVSDYATDKQTTTITGTSYSIYNSSPVSPKSDTASFDTTFNDPCLDPSFL